MTQSPSKSQAFRQKVADTLAGAKTTPQRQDGPSGRFYLVDDQAFPSVTHILQCIGKPALINWAANQERTLVTEAAADLYEDLAKITQQMPRTAYITTLQARLGKTKAHRRELEKASEIGTQVHALIEWNLRRELGQQVGPEPRVQDDAQWAFMSYQDWANSVQLKPRFIEQTVFSRTYGYAGTMDLLADVNGILTLIDFKTGKAIYGEAHLQNVAYQMALREMGHSVPNAGLVVRLPKIQNDPAFETQQVPMVEEVFPVFLAVKQLWTWWYAQDEAYRQKQKALKETA
jgi:hypothetical protein